MVDCYNCFYLEQILVRVTQVDFFNHFFTVFCHQTGYATPYMHHLKCIAACFHKLKCLRVRLGIICPNRRLHDEGVGEQPGHAVKSHPLFWSHSREKSERNVKSNRNSIRNARIHQKVARPGINVESTQSTCGITTCGQRQLDIQEGGPSPLDLKYYIHCQFVHYNYKYYFVLLLLILLLLLGAGPTSPQIAGGFVFCQQPRTKLKPDVQSVLKPDGISILRLVHSSFFNLLFNTYPMPFSSLDWSIAPFISPFIYYPFIASSKCIISCIQ
jgi:hypothetical protein